MGEIHSGATYLAQEPDRRTVLTTFLLAGAVPLLRKADTVFTPDRAEATNGSLITVRNGQFYQHGRPIGFVGENWYSLGENNTAANNQICGPILSDGQRQQWMRDARSLGMNIVRFWDFPELTNNGQNTSAADRAIAYAAQNGMSAYLTLENNFHDCTNGADKKTDWYAQGYKKTYIPYVKAMTKKYKGDHRVFAFQLINEAQCDDPEVLKNFAYDVLNEVKNIDPQRLVTLGLLGVDQPGVIGDNFRKLFTPRNKRDYHFDFMDIHDWPGSEHGSYQGLHGDSVNGIYARLHTAQQLNMPLLISEIGQVRTNGVTHQRAANEIRTEVSHLLTSRYRHFVAGVLGWELLPRGVSQDIYSYDWRSPEAQVFHQFASKIKDPRLR